MRYRAPGERPDDNGPERFLVDGVPPAVIGEGPPEVGPPDTDWAPDAGDRPPPRRPEPRRREPPTDEIPVIRQQPDEPAPRPRKSLLARVFRLRQD